MINNKNRWPPAMHLLGYKVIETSGTTIHGDHIGLAFALFDADGEELDRTDDVEQWPDKTSNYPKMHRLRLLMDAMCRYRNTGGAEFENDYATDVLMQEIVTAFVSLPILNWPDEWDLWSTEPGEHYLVSEKDDKKTYLRIVENEFTEALDEAQFLELKTGKKMPEEVESN